MPVSSPLIRGLLLLGGCWRPRVEVGADTVTIRMGYGWRSQVPRASIRAAGPGPDRVISIGAHGWRGRWLVNTRREGLVALTLDPAATGRCFGVRHRLTRLTISVCDPEAFLAVLRAPEAG